MFSSLFSVNVFLPQILSVKSLHVSVVAPYLTLSQFLIFPISQVIHVLFLIFFTFRNLCHLLIVLDFWAPSLRAQALRESPEMQEQRP